MPPKQNMCDKMQAKILNALAKRPPVKQLEKIYAAQQLKKLDEKYKLFLGKCINFDKGDTKQAGARKDTIATDGRDCLKYLNQIKNDRENLLQKKIEKVVLKSDKDLIKKFDAGCNYRGNEFRGIDKKFEPYVTHEINITDGIRKYTDNKGTFQDPRNIFNPNGKLKNRIQDYTDPSLYKPIPIDETKVNMSTIKDGYNKLYSHNTNIYDYLKKKRHPVYNNSNARRPGTIPKARKFKAIYEKKYNYNNRSEYEGSDYSARLNRQQNGKTSVVKPGTVSFLKQNKKGIVIYDSSPTRPKSVKNVKNESSKQYFVSIPNPHLGGVEDGVNNPIPRTNTPHNFNSDKNLSNTNSRPVQPKKNNNNLNNLPNNLNNLPNNLNNLNNLSNSNNLNNISNSSPMDPFDYINSNIYQNVSSNNVINDGENFFNFGDTWSDYNFLNQSPRSRFGSIFGQMSDYAQINKKENENIIQSANKVQMDPINTPSLLASVTEKMNEPVKQSSSIIFKPEVKGWGKSAEKSKSSSKIVKSPKLVDPKPSQVQNNLNNLNNLKNTGPENKQPSSVGMVGKDVKSQARSKSANPKGLGNMNNFNNINAGPSQKNQLTEKLETMFGMICNHVLGRLMEINKENFGKWFNKITTNAKPPISSDSFFKALRCQVRYNGTTYNKGGHFKFTINGTNISFDEDNKSTSVCFRRLFESWFDVESNASIVNPKLLNDHLNIFEMPRTGFCGYSAFVSAWLYPTLTADERSKFDIDLAASILFDFIKNRLKTPKIIKKILTKFNTNWGILNPVNNYFVNLNSSSLANAKNRIDKAKITNGQPDTCGWADETVFQIMAELFDCFITLIINDNRQTTNLDLVNKNPKKIFSFGDPCVDIFQQFLVMKIGDHFDGAGYKTSKLRPRNRWDLLMIDKIFGNKWQTVKTKSNK
jgi:hypothetical protein